MATVPKQGKVHIYESLKQIDSDTWRIGSFILHRTSGSSATATWTDESDNSSYTLTKASSSHPPATSSPNSPHISIIHQCGDASIVWAIGKSAVCKIRYIEKDVTPESVTLNFVQDQRPSFETPKVLYHAFDEDRSYLFLQRLPGATLDKAWPSLSEQSRMDCVKRVVDICKEMSQWEGNWLGGVDHQYAPEDYLRPKGAKDYSSLQASCETLGMDCSRFFFYHADLGPGNIIVEPESGRLSIIDFEIAGYFPKAWIRTKFRLSSGMNLSHEATSGDRGEWRKQVQIALGAEGFTDHAEAFMQWRKDR